ncbi:MAG: NUDIX hydrolase [Candidatus Nealsonbacteria bacterium]|nr:NUDIX hydrolase [Candidatus Nealsonbacteria bacterium]
MPITCDDQLVLIRQYRHGIRRISLEVPGGIVDPGESPEEAAVRELEEETGYAPGHIRPLGRISANPAIQNNYCHIFLAEDCRRVAAAQLDPFEEIELAITSPQQIPGLVQSEEICHSLVINALALASLLRP